MNELEMKNKEKELLRKDIKNYTCKTRKHCIRLENLENKTVTILASRNAKFIKAKNKYAIMKNTKLLRRDRPYLHLENIDHCSFLFIPSTLKQDRVFIEPLGSTKLRDKLDKKYRRR